MKPVRIEGDEIVPVKEKKRVVAQQKTEEHQAVYETLDEVAARFKESNIDVHQPDSSGGLSTQRVQQLLERDGYNELTPPEQKSQWVLLGEQFLNPFMLLLFAAGVLSVVAYGIDSTEELNLVLGCVLFGVVVLTCLMSWSQQRKTIKTMSSFKNILPTNSICIRDGKKVEVPARELVVGDIVLLQIGQKVPADVRVLLSPSLKVENGAITGESEPVDLDYSRVEDKATTIVEEAKNIAFNGSLIQDGSGVGVVLATGDRSILGQIAVLTTGQKENPSTMEVEVERFVRFISVLAVSMALIFFIIAVARRAGEGALDAFINGFLIIIVANVPQGLPATVTSLQLIVAKKLSLKNVFVKRLDAVETLGAVTVICSDKTGTLTQNKMTVVDSWVNCEVGIHFFSEALLNTALRSSFVTKNETFAERAMASVTVMQLVSCVCNTSVGSPAAMLPGDNMKEVGVATIYNGNPSEVALVTFFEQLQPGSVARLREYNPFVFEVPFNSKNKYHVVIVRGRYEPEKLLQKKEEKETEEDYTILMKGAPEVILKKCDRYLLDGKLWDVDEEFNERAQEAYGYFARRGQRVLGFAIQAFKGPANPAQFEVKKGNFPLDGLIFIGMMALMDPPRPEVPSAIVNCRAAGIKVYMVTGDYPLTAAAIAGQIGLLPQDSAVVQYEAGAYGAEEGENASLVIHGREVEKFTDDDWRFVLSHKNLVFARTTPQHKLQISDRCQILCEEVVCMTGDGVNDAPAMKRSNIGVSMGINGTEVARDASNVILMDDSFGSIVLGVEQGRVLFDNLKKTIAYTLCHLAPEIVPILLTLAFGFPGLLSSLQILSIDLFTELAPAISLAYEKKESDVMDQKPRNIKVDRLVSTPLLLYAYAISGLAIEAVACFIASCIVFWENGINIADIAFVDGDYFENPSNPFAIVPGWGDFCSGTNCFTADQQVTIIQQARGAWYIVLICSQILHIWMVKTRRTSLFRHGVSNMVMNYGVVVEFTLMIIFVAVPGLNTGLFSAELPPGLAVLPLIYSFVMLWGYNEGRKLYFRKHRDSVFKKLFFW